MYVEIYFIGTNVSWHIKVERTIYVYKWEQQDTFENLREPLYVEIEKWNEEQRDEAGNILGQQIY